MILEKKSLFIGRFFASWNLHLFALWQQKIDVSVKIYIHTNASWAPFEMVWIGHKSYVCLAVVQGLTNTSVRCTSNKHRSQMTKYGFCLYPWGLPSCYEFLPHLTTPFIGWKTAGNKEVCYSLLETIGYQLHQGAATWCIMWNWR